MMHGRKIFVRVVKRRMQDEGEQQRYNSEYTSF